MDVLASEIDGDEFFDSDGAEAERSGILSPEECVRDGGDAVE